jgi:hypothetical protein
MPSSASTSIPASPEIARFGGMVFYVFYDDQIEPHVEVMVKGMKFRFSPLKVRKQVQEWLKTEMPGLRRAVRELVYDQWLKVRNSQPVEHVPTPDEIKVLARPKKIPKESAQHYNHYAIKRIQVLPDFHLKVWFKNGDVKLADVKAMQGHNEAFAPVWTDFGKAKSRVYDVEWPVVFPSGPNTIEIEDQDLWGAGVDECSQCGHMEESFAKRAPAPKRA